MGIIDNPLEIIKVRSGAEPGLRIVQIKTNYQQVEVEVLRKLAGGRTLNNSYSTLFSKIQLQTKLCQATAQITESFM